jgi:hypothetical protein
MPDLIRHPVAETLKDPGWIMLNRLPFVNGQLTAQFSLPILSLRNFTNALPHDGGGLPASGGAKGDQGFGWG